jgi:hypothetical protein
MASRQRSPTMAVQHHPVQSRKGEIFMLDLPTTTSSPLKQDDLSSPSLSYLLSLLPSLPLCLIIRVKFYLYILLNSSSRRKRVRSRFLKIRLLALISLDLSSPPNSAHDRKTQSSVLNPLERHSELRRV